MRSVSFLVVVVVVLGAGVARGGSLEHRDLEAQDTSKKIGDGWSDIVERHDHGLFAAQYPVSQTENPLAEITDEEGINSIDHIIDPAETHTTQNSLSNKDNQANTHAILKRVPDFLTFNIPVYRSGFATSLRPVDIPVTITLGTEAPVTFTKKINGPVTVTVTVTATKTVTSFINLGKTAFEFTRAPPNATDEFLTFAYRTVTRQITLLVLSGRGVYTTLTSPVTVTVIEGVGPTVTVTETFTRTRSFFEDTLLPFTTRTVALPRFRTRRVITTTTTTTIVSVLPTDSPKPWTSHTRTGE